MNNYEVSIKEVKGWVNAYLDCKEDTDTAIGLLKNEFMETDFNDADGVNESVEHNPYRHILSYGKFIQTING